MYVFSITTVTVKEIEDLREEFSQFSVNDVLTKEAFQTILFKKLGPNSPFVKELFAVCLLFWMRS